MVSTSFCQPALQHGYHTKRTNLIYIYTLYIHNIIDSHSAFGPLDTQAARNIYCFYILYAWIWVGI